MNLATRCNHHRIYFLIINELREHSKLLLLIFVSVTLLLMFNSQHYYISRVNEYYGILFLGGLMLTANSFKDLHNRQRAQFFLMLPCSTFERFLSKWLFTTTLYIVFSLLVYLTMGFLISILNHFIFGSNVTLINIPFHHVGNSIVLYFIIQSVFLLGSVTFGKHPVIKTSLSGGILVFLLGSFIAFLCWLYYCPNCIKHILGPALEYTIYFYRDVFWFLLTPFCLVMTYLKLRECELR